MYRTYVMQFLELNSQKLFTGYNVSQISHKTVPLRFALRLL